MARLVEDVQVDYPEESEALNIAEALGNLFERSLIRDNVMPRITGNSDVTWLLESGLAFAVKSSVDQFVAEGVIRIQINGREARERWFEWLES